MNTAPSNPTRRLLRISLAVILLLTLAIAVVVGWTIHEARRQGIAVSALEKLGCLVEYDWSERPPTVLERIRSLLREGQTKNVAKVSGDGVPLADADVVHLQALPQLLEVSLKNTRITDAGLANLQGLTRIEILRLDGTPVGDAGMINLRGLNRLEELGLDQTKVTEAGLAHLRELTHLCGLFIRATPVSDLSPLRGMPLATLDCLGTPVSELSPLRDCKNLRRLNVAKTKVTVATVAALKKSLPSCDILWADASNPITDVNDPEFQKWMKGVVALPVERQVDAVAWKLQQLNPGFNGKLAGWGGTGRPKIDDGAVTVLWFDTDNVMDISPVRALVDLRTLSCSGSAKEKNKLFDLSPLQGMKLTSLNCAGTQVSDLSPLQSVRTLSSLNVANTNVTPADVAALQKALPDCKIEWDGAKSASPAGGGAKRPAPESAGSDKK